jgi:hypothetical protein
MEQQDLLASVHNSDQHRLHSIIKVQLIFLEAILRDPSDWISGEKVLFYTVGQV